MPCGQPGGEGRGARFFPRRREGDRGVAELVDDLVFELGWRPGDVRDLTISEIFYWYGRALARAERRKREGR
ncbi:MAG: hypothetical protein DI534_16450 [Leifsonia xyli]|nr:MAG: hypothetical protein DI534_16450 [Leifsonia xyli]